MKTNLKNRIIYLACSATFPHSKFDVKGSMLGIDLLLLLFSGFDACNKNLN